MNRFVTFVCWFAFFFFQFAFANVSFEKEINGDGEISQFASLFHRQTPGTFIKYGSTVFAPINKAIRTFNQTYQISDSDSDLPSQHTTLQQIDISNLPALYQAIVGQPIWVQQVIDAHGSSHYFANNAKLLGHPKTFTNSLGTMQLVKIDEVFNSATFERNVVLEVLDLINNFNRMNFEKYNQGEIKSAFAQLIANTQTEHLFQNKSEVFTVFLPIDRVNSKASADQVRLHIVPGKAIFLRPWALQGQPIASDLSDSQVQAQLHLEQPIMNTLDNNRLPVVRAQIEPSLSSESASASTTVDARIGNTYSEVVIPNIVLKNAVVHFINQPFSQASHDLYSLTALLAQSKLSRFFEFIRGNPNFAERLAGGSRKTLFAFTDAAFERVAEHLKTLNASAQEQILHLHFSEDDSVHSSNIIQGRPVKLHTASSISNGVLHVSLENVGQEKWLYVEGGKVKARAVEANILATNGQLHIIDKVLGLPYQTVMETLQTDPFLWQTYNVSVSPRNHQWGMRLNQTQSKFTLFAPSETAWKALQATYGSYFKQITDRLYLRNNLAILDRHLVLNQAYTLNELVELGQVETMRSTLKIRSDGVNVILEWEGLQAQVERGDIQTVNGVIHAINRVLFKESDMKVSEEDVNWSSNTKASGLLITLSILLFALLF